MRCRQYTRSSNATTPESNKSVRRFLLRGLDNIRGEWRLVCVTHNLLKIWRNAGAPVTA